MARYYARGGSYQHFVGRDASRSFVTGDSADSKLTDSIAELSDDALGAGLGKEDGVSWDEYWRNLYQKIDERQLDEFRSGYQGSDEEREEGVAIIHSVF